MVSSSLLQMAAVICQGVLERFPIWNNACIGRVLADSIQSFGCWARRRLPLWVHSLLSLEEVQDGDHAAPQRTISSFSSYSTSSSESESETRGSGSLAHEEEEETEEEEEWPRLLRRLDENDPSLTELVLSDSLYQEEQHYLVLHDTYVVLKEPDVQALAQALRQNTRVTHLTIRNLTIASASHVYLLLEAMPHLTVLHLEDTRGVAMETLAHILASQSETQSRQKDEDKDKGTNSLPLIPPFQATSKALDDEMDTPDPQPKPPLLTKLEELRLNHAPITLSVAKLLSQALTNTTTSTTSTQKIALRRLDFQGSRLNDASLTVLCRAMADNKAVRSWCLDFNTFGETGLQALAQMLQYNTCLQELHLFGNQINATGATHLANGLIANTGLKTLVLSLNDMGNDGAAALAHALTRNTTLEKLWMPSNNVGNPGLLAVAQCMPHWKGLRHINVGDSFDESAAIAILKALEHNKFLRQLYLESPTFSCERMDAHIDFYLRLNRAGRHHWLQQHHFTPDDQHRPQQTLQDTEEESYSNPNVFLADHVLAHAIELTNRFTSFTGSPDVLYHLLRQKPDLCCHRNR